MFELIIIFVLFIIIYLIFNYYHCNNICYMKNSDGYNIDYNYKPIINDTFDNIIEFKEKYEPIKCPRIVWMYWENINRNTYPSYIALCLYLTKKHLKNYNVVILDSTTIKLFLNNIRSDFENLETAQKVDYYRVALLHKYGGIWLDADIIIMKNLDEIFEKIDEGYDFVGFGCTGNKCDYGYNRPSNWVMASRPNGILMKKYLEKLDEKLNIRDKNIQQNHKTYHDYGKLPLWNSIDDLVPLGYKYYHFNSEVDGARDINKNWIHIHNFFKESPTKFLNEDKLIFVVLYNSEIKNNPKYNWIFDCKIDRLLEGNEWICQLFKKSYNLIK